MKTKRAKLMGTNTGMTLVEIMVGMVIFAIGLLSLSQVMFRVMHSNLSSKHMVIATNLAHQRMEQILSSTRYDNITEANFADEDYGQINGGDENFSSFRRIVRPATWNSDRV